MSAIRALPPVSEESESPKREWSHAQGVLFTGGLLALLVCGTISGLSIWQALSLDVGIPEGQKKAEEAREKVSSMSAAELWGIWSYGYGTQPLGEWKESRLAGARRWRKNFIAMGSIFGVIAAGGLGAMIYSLAASGRAGRISSR